jgi:hypothetical protein
VSAADVIAYRDGGPIVVTVPRYIAVVAVAYLAAFTIFALPHGAAGVGSAADLVRLWPMVVGAIAIATFGTLAPMARFGAVGGSIFVLPTALHVFTLVAFGIAVATVAK